MTPDTNGWGHSEMYVLEELKRLSAAVERNGVTLNNLRLEVGKRGAMWGAISGAIITVIGFLARR